MNNNNNNNNGLIINDNNNDNRKMEDTRIVLSAEPETNWLRSVNTKHVIALVCPGGLERITIDIKILKVMQQITARYEGYRYMITWLNIKRSSYYYYSYCVGDLTNNHSLFIIHMVWSYYLWG